MKPPEGFSEDGPEAASEGRPEAEIPREASPRGFSAEGLPKDAAKGLPEENPEGDFTQHLKVLC